MHPAYLYKKKDNNIVQCNLCNHFCVIGPGSKGICGVRVNKCGELFTLVYEKPVAENVDPIEKKPFYHFLPGSSSYSIAAVGCNFQCGFCQNYEISQAPGMGYEFKTSEVDITRIIDRALKYKCESISYTYTEPTIFFEMAYDISKSAKEKGIKNCFVTNGYMSPEALDMIAPYLDAANVDLKGNEIFYRKLCKAHFQPVINTIKRMKELGIWVEVTTLIIQDYNDDNETFELMAENLYNIDPQIPWHFSRFFPVFRMSEHYPTGVEIIHKFREKALKYGFKHVYTGNIPGNNGENTFCPKCSTPVIKRLGYMILEKNIKDNNCPGCGHPIAGIFK
ncbi:MAG: AmmeMemoRadiSam system radical SAM enzyme [Candidatus Omnitrophica bacterium]|nr:AmmeMemoRadiSam system radical SAM enzyme [Candidatus Omnitrophota bacterium]